MLWHTLLVTPPWPLCCWPILLTWIRVWYIMSAKQRVTKQDEKQRKWNSPISLHMWYTRLPILVRKHFYTFCPLHKTMIIVVPKYYTDFCKIKNILSIFSITFCSHNCHIWFECIILATPNEKLCGPSILGWLYKVNWKPGRYQWV